MKFTISNPAGTPLLATPGGEMTDFLSFNDPVTDTGNVSGDFMQVQPRQGPIGWIAKADCEAAGRPDLDPETFVAECLIAERTINALAATTPWFISADFLIARAVIETNLTNAGPKIDGSDAVGPLQVSSLEWKNFLQNGGQAAAGYQPGDFDDWLMQVWGAAFRMFTDAKAITSVKLANGVGKADDPPLPSYLEVFLAYLTNSAKAAVALVNATTTDADKGETAPAGNGQGAGPGQDKKLKDFLGGLMTDTEIAAFFKARGALTGPIDNSNKVGDFVTNITTSLNTALQGAFDKIKQFFPDELPVVAAGAGTAPWFDVATAEEAKHVKEPDPRILDYFKSINFAGATTHTAWCAAFASFCMKNSGNPTAAGSVPAHDPALASSWRGWGSALPLNSTDVPKGAVVVLSPTEPNDGSGHVGFFLNGNTNTMTLLGGNQSHAVKESTFARTRVVALRWMDVTAPATGAAGIATINMHGLNPRQQDMANLIIKKFAAAGFGKVQQIAAVANAKGESGLIPDGKPTIGPREHSVGLFQLNMEGGGVGTGHSEAELLNPERNTDLIIAVANRIPSFRNATTLEAAVRAFVIFVENPKDKPGQIAIRLNIAQTLIV